MQFGNMKGRSDAPLPAADDVTLDDLQHIMTKDLAGKEGIYDMVKLDKAVTEELMGTSTNPVPVHRSLAPAIFQEHKETKSAKQSAGNGDGSAYSSLGEYKKKMSFFVDWLEYAHRTDTATVLETTVPENAEFEKANGYKADTGSGLYRSDLWQQVIGEEFKKRKLVANVDDFNLFHTEYGPKMQGNIAFEHAVDPHGKALHDAAAVKRRRVMKASSDEICTLQDAATAKRRRLQVSSGEVCAGAK